MIRAHLLLVFWTLTAWPSDLPRVGEVAVRVGDDLQWAQPDFDDGDWKRIDWRDLRPYRELLWLRAELEVGGTPDYPVGLFLSGMYSAEVYWDGQLLGRKGHPALRRDNEVAGRMDHMLWVTPDLLTPGPHKLAIRLSNHYLQLPVHRPLHNIALGHYGDSDAMRLRYYLPAILTLGGLLLAALYFLGRFWREGRARQPLWLALTCLATLGQLTAEVSRSLWSYTYDWHLWRLFAVLAFAWLFGSFLVAYVGSRLDVRNWKIYSGLATVCGLPLVSLDVGFDPMTLWLLLLYLVLAMALAVYGFLRHKPGSGWAMLGLSFFAITLVVTQQLFLDRYLFVGFWGLLAILFYVEVVELSREKEARQASEQTMKRLELDLLKKHLQPHFLINSLTSLAEWFEENPVKGSQMIEQLAEEARILYDIAHKRLIPMGTELALCHAHLEIMGGRQDLEYRLLCQGVDPNRQVPPAVIHTLVENAVTHNQYSESPILFKLEEQVPEAGLLEYRFTSPPGIQCQPPDVCEGTGTAYIRLRLAEAFGEKWQFLACPGADGGWTSVIRLIEV